MICLMYNLSILPVGFEFPIPAPHALIRRRFKFQALKMHYHRSYQMTIQAPLKIISQDNDSSSQYDIGYGSVQGTFLLPVRILSLKIIFPIPFSIHRASTDSIRDRLHLLRIELPTEDIKFQLDIRMEPGCFRYRWASVCKNGF
ncbi:hypothetical protein Ccrd_005758 [Cynara cardunculus var. scolymus]|uniref:Uncharacterized protein n=1 Tax=Cynara cardunculus var. scolymus TaxID=59895 RepID=A0A103XK27_CYNCS|nr:hypothetical protein Ccrd_005758 [Cynara cardunculus var. scolymus]